MADAPPAGGLRWRLRGMRALLAGLVRTHRSAGVPVSRVVHRLIAQGNGARDRGDWRGASDRYHAALAIAPGLHHIRLQAGHMLKEGGALNEAGHAYATLARLCPLDPEPLIHHAHLIARCDGPGAALPLFIAAVRLGDRQGVAERDVRDLLDLGDEVSSDLLRSIVAATDPVCPPDPGASSIPDTSDGAQRPLVLDVTDLIRHFRHQRAPTGVQRVQIEVLKLALADDNAGQAIVACFLNGRRTMVRVPAAPLRALLALAAAEGAIDDPAWQDARIRLFLRLYLAAELTLPMRALLVSLGAAAWGPDLFLFLRNAKTQRQAAYIPFVHDLVPVLLPECCVEGVRREFSTWITGALAHADGFLLNSRSTASDLIHVAAALGTDLPDQQLEVVPLNGRIDPPPASAPIEALSALGLTEGGYVLMVSTIEPRKNHLLAFDAWAELLCTEGAAMPLLVCVGRDGWLNDRVYARLASDPLLIANVRLIHTVSDAEMDLLYRHCRFTLYPSRYEGWGLPVTESLLHGRLAIVADNSALPEAAAGVAEMVETGSVPALVTAVRRALRDPAWLKAREALIKQEFSARPWREVAVQLLDAARRLGASARASVEPPTILRGVYYPFARRDALEPWGRLPDGAELRAGAGWLWPDAQGCRSEASGAALRFALGNDGRARAGDRPILFLRVQGLATEDCRLTIEGGIGPVDVPVPANGAIWIPVPLPADSEAPRIVTLRSDATEEVRLSLSGKAVTCRASLTIVGVLLGDAAQPDADRRLMTNVAGWRCSEPGRR